MSRYPGASGAHRVPGRYGWIYPLFYVPGLTLLVMWLGR